MACLALIDKAAPHCRQCLEGDHDTARLYVDRSALRFAHQTFAFSQVQPQLLQFAIGAFKLSQSDRYTTASIVFKSCLNDHPHDCLHYCY